MNFNNLDRSGIFLFKKNIGIGQMITNMMNIYHPLIGFGKLFYIINRNPLKNLQLYHREKIK